VPGIDDGDGLFRCDAVTYRGSYVVEICLNPRRPDRSEWPCL